jgi:hypothetical protein
MVGLCALAFAIVAGARGGLRRKTGPRWFRFVHTVALVGALGLAVAIVGAMLFGNRHVKLFALDLGSAARLMETFVPLALGAIAFSPTAQAAWRNRSPSAFYLAAVFVSIVMAMGPYPRAFRIRIWDHSPYLGLMAVVPGFTGLRVPARFTLIAVLCLAILTGLVLARLHFTKAWRERLVYGAILGALLFETWPGWFRLVDLPAAGPDLSTASTVLELPLSRTQGLDAMYRATLHGRPLMNGYSGYFPPAPDVLGVCFYRFDEECLDRMRRVIGPMDMMIELSRDPDGHWEQVVRHMHDAQLRVRDAGFAVYRFPAPATRLAPPLSVRSLISVPAKSMTSTIDSTHASWAVDRDWSTAWTTERGQEINDSVTVEATDTISIGGIELESGDDNPQDFPGALRIESSEDGQRWSAAWDGSTDDARFATMMLEGINAVRITWPARPARFLRLTITVNESARPWSIAELALLRVP